MKQIKQIVDLGYKLYASHIETWFKVPETGQEYEFLYQKPYVRRYDMNSVGLKRPLNNHFGFKKIFHLVRDVTTETDMLQDDT
jgi:hypothetical protein